MRGYTWACDGDGDDGYVDERSSYYGVPGMSFILQSKCSGIFHIQRPAGYQVANRTYYRWLRVIKAASCSYFPKSSNSGFADESPVVAR